MRVQTTALRAPRTETPANNSGARQRPVGGNAAGTYQRQRHKARVILPIEDGCVFILSDAHYYGEPSRSHLASLKLAQRMKPWALINNGDTIDGASISRWPVGSFIELAGRPSVAEEINLAAKRLADYERMGFAKYRVWNLGNHDSRFETRLAEKVPEYAGVDGFRLKDHFPEWLPAWRTDFERPDGHKELIVQHRYKGGMHAGQNNVLWSGTNYVTGHDHMLKAYSITNAHGLFWGIHAGTLAPIDSKLFVHYTEDRPVNWQEGFVILWFKDNQFSGPELVHVHPDGRVIFRGEELNV